MRMTTFKHRYYELLTSQAVQVIVPFVVICLLFAPLLANRSNEATRYDLMWQTSDTVFLTGGMFLIAVVVSAVGRRLRRSSYFWLRNAPNAILIISLGAGVLANVAFYAEQWMVTPFLKSGALMHMGWLVLMLLAGCAWAKPSFALTHHARQATLILTPAACIMVLQLFVNPTYPARRDPLPPTRPASEVHIAQTNSVDRPIYLFLFDAWSYERSYDNGKLRPGWTNLAALSEQSLVFHDARSLGSCTMSSLPRLLFQSHDEATWQGAQMGFMQADQFTPTSQLNTLFSIVEDANYRTFMIGTGCPYNLWLDGHVDVCRSYGYYLPEANTPLRGLVNLLAGTQYWTDPCFPALYWMVQKKLDKTRMRQIYRDSACDIFNIISQQPRRTFAVFHYLLPHPPYAMTDNGSYVSDQDRSYTTDDPRGYQRNLACLDDLIGRFIEAMKSARRFDDALVILSSDHSWHQEPERKKGRFKGSICHVPLIVKLPGQRRPLEVTTRFTHQNLGELIRYAMTVGPEPESDIESLLAEWSTHDDDPSSIAARPLWNSRMKVAPAPGTGG